ncbi:MAG: IS1634 family transposase [Clostridia bacterium]
MANVFVKNKKNGVTYVYQSESYWDKEKKQSRSKRVCIGKLDENSEFVSSKRFEKPLPVISQSADAVTKEAKRRFYGATYLLDSIGRQTGVSADLKTCFPDCYQKIESIAYYLIMEDRNSLSRFPKWQRTHLHPYGEDIPSQRSSELFSSITEEAKNHFFRLQCKRRMEHEFWAYDTTSISSYSESLKQVRYGHNKDHDPLPQINLALLFGEESNLPFYYRKLPGNITDVKTVMNLLADIKDLDFGKIKLVMDKGFYSEENINGLYSAHLKFLISAKTSLKYVQNELQAVRNTIRTRANYHSDAKLYAHTSTINWNYHQKRPNKGDVLSETRRMYLHLFFSGEKALEHENSFNAMLDMLEAELVSGSRNPEHEKQYAKYFDVCSTPVRGHKVTVKQDVVDDVEKDYGFFVLISNEIKDPIAALELYRNKDVVEKAFGNLKERLDLRTTCVSSDLSLDGKLFVQFIALIYMSYIKKQMQLKKLGKSYTMQELLDELDVIECFEQPGVTRRIGEITSKQKMLYENLGVPPLGSL